jgi:hypothetical protein
VAWFAVFSVTMTVFVHVVVASSAKKFHIASHMGLAATAAVFALLAAFSVGLWIDWTVRAHRSSPDALERASDVTTEAAS